MMNFVSKTWNCVSKTRNCVFSPSWRQRCRRIPPPPPRRPPRPRGAAAEACSSRSTCNCKTNGRFFNSHSSFFRGNSPLSLHFQGQFSIISALFNRKLGMLLAFRLQSAVHLQQRELLCCVCVSAELGGTVDPTHHGGICQRSIKRHISQVISAVIPTSLERSGYGGDGVCAHPFLIRTFMTLSERISSPLVAASYVIICHHMSSYVNRNPAFLNTKASFSNRKSSLLRLLTWGLCQHTSRVRCHRTCQRPKGLRRCRSVPTPCPCEHTPGSQLKVCVLCNMQHNILGLD